MNLGIAPSRLTEVTFCLQTHNSTILANTLGHKQAQSANACAHAACPILISKEVTLQEPTLKQVRQVECKSINGNTQAKLTPACGCRFFAAQCVISQKTEKRFELITLQNKQNIIQVSVFDLKHDRFAPAPISWLSYCFRLTSLMERNLCSMDY